MGDGGATWDVGTAEAPCLWPLSLLQKSRHLPTLLSTTAHILWPQPPAALVSFHILELTKSFLTPGLSTCHSPWSERLFLWPNSQPSVLSPNLTCWWMTCLTSPFAYVYFTSTLHFSTKAHIRSINQWIFKISLVPSSQRGSRLHEDSDSQGGFCWISCPSRVPARYSVFIKQVSAGTEERMLEEISLKRVKGKVAEGKVVVHFPDHSLKDAS